MINLIISLVIGAAAWVATAFLFDSVWSGIIPFIVASLAAMVVLNRKTSQKVMVIMKQAETMMQEIPKLPSQNARTNMLDKAVNQLKKAYEYKNYAFFLEQQINAQIGTIYYVQQRFDEAEPFLANAFPQQSMAVCMYGCIMFRKKKEAEMIAAFEKAFKFSRNNPPVLWNLYAWCLDEMGKRDAAIAVLNRALLENASDQITRDNLDGLKNGKKMKMRGFNELWYQFWLDENPMMAMQKAMLDKHSVVRSH